VKLDREYATTVALVSLPHKKQTAIMKKFSAYAEEWFRY